MSKNAQCVALTASNQPCKKNPSENDSNSLCHIHASVKPWRLRLHGEKEPWEWYGFASKSLKYLDQDSQRIKLRELCRRLPTEIDRSGYIYIYVLDKDKGKPWYKIGTTERHVQVRLKEWSDAKLIRAFGVAHHKMAETLLFTLLSCFRQTRIYDKKAQCYVTDTANKKHTVKHVEWFYFEDGLQVLFDIVRDVVRVINVWPKRFKRFQSWSIGRLKKK